MLPYYILVFIPIIICLIGLIKDKKSNKLCINAFFIILITELALRSIKTGTDLTNYKYFFDIFQTLRFNELLNYSEKGEILYYFLNKIISHIGGDFQFFLFVCALLSLIPVLILYYKKSDNSLLTIALFLTVAPFTMYFSGLRQSIAMGIIIFGFKYIENKNLFKYMLCVLVAYYFHQSAMFCIILYPLFYVNITKKWLYFIIPIMLSIFIFRVQVFGALIQFLDSSYQENYNIIESTGAYSILILLIMFCFYTFIFPSKDKIGKEFIGLRNFLLLATCIQFFASINPIVMRINYYVLLFIPILIPKVRQYCEKDNIKIANIAEITMIAFFITYFFYNGYTGADILNVFPYVPFWEV